MDKNIENILNRLPDEVSEYFKNNNEKNITEIRVRKGFDIKVCADGIYHNLMNTTVSEMYINSLYYSFCDNTVSAYEEQTGKGFLTLPGGHRIGLAGKYISDDKGGNILTEVFSMNIRINRFHLIDFDKKILDFSKGLLLAGKPHSGKTTFIKNLCYILQDKNVVVCDERNELYISDLCCDFIINMPKEKAIIQALRTLNPDYIICDELGTEESHTILNGVNSGVKFVCSVHCGYIEELYNKPDISSLLHAGAFDKIVLLDNNRNYFFIKEIRDV